MTHIDQEDHGAYHCITCGDSAFPEDLCATCSRCIDCHAELGCRRTRVVADEIEEGPTRARN